MQPLPRLNKSTKWLYQLFRQRHKSTSVTFRIVNLYQSLIKIDILDSQSLDSLLPLALYAGRGDCGVRGGNSQLTTRSSHPRSAHPLFPAVRAQAALAIWFESLPATADQPSVRYSIPDQAIDDSSLRASFFNHRRYSLNQLALQCSRFLSFLLTLPRSFPPTRSRILMVSTPFGLKRPLSKKRLFRRICG